MISKILTPLINKVRGEFSTDDLINDGLRVGKNFNRQEKVIIDPSHCYLISIGDNVTFAPRVHVLAHDASLKKTLGYTKIGRVSFGDNVFIGAGSIILPNVKVGNNVIVAAGSVVTKDIEDGFVVAGNPAKFINFTSDVTKRNQEKANATTVFDKKWKDATPSREQRKQDMIKATKDGVAYIEV